LNGKPSNQYVEKVIVSYIDCGGQDQTYGEFSAASVSSANISIQDVVQSITVTLTDDLDGDSGNSVMSVSMGEVSSCIAPVPLPPVGDFEGSPTTVTVGNTVNFSDLSLNDPTSWDWSFAGGTPASSTEQNPTVTYNTEGGYTVSLTVTNPDGSDTETKVNYITVAEAGCTPVSNDFPTDPLTHSGTGSSSTSYDFGTPGHTDVSFVVSDLGAKINGNPNNRYIDLVTVTYTDAGGAQTYGTFSGENTSSANVDIAGPVYSVTVTLEDAYDGIPPGDLSVDPGSISSCPPPGGAMMIASNINTDIIVHDIAEFSVYPNPASDLVTFRLAGVENAASLTIYDHLGRSMWKKQLEAGQHTVQLDLAKTAFQNGMYFVSLASQGERITKHLVVVK
jgi:PKD repeat protein